MPRTAPWQTATIQAIAQDTPRVKSFRFGGIEGVHKAGQHVDIRLTGPNGRQTKRSYSIASAPGDPKGLELMIEILDEGEVSAYFDRAASVGDEIELRGPLGGSFHWEPKDDGPVLLIGGGSGVVPLLSMLRARSRARCETPMLLIYSVRTASEAIAREEMQARSRDETGFDLTLLTTREGATAGRRVDRVMIETALDHIGTPRHVFVCGGNAFVGCVSDLLRDAGIKPGVIRAERFGG